MFARQWGLLLYCTAACCTYRLSIAGAHGGKLVRTILQTKVSQDCKTKVTARCIHYLYSACNSPGRIGTEASSSDSPPPRPLRRRLRGGTLRWPGSGARRTGCTCRGTALPGAPVAARRRSSQGGTRSGSRDRRCRTRRQSPTLKKICFHHLIVCFDIIFFIGLSPGSGQCWGHWQVAEAPSKEGRQRENFGHVV